ncbi:hypothetical protein [Plebeiibacterium marinum]|uniref:Uncharacterized protein n=1 Tax=Plebeiibacterium marinum TaxID=2992111 RepID=A0AAE3MFK6_9BACT|nr:hypothetical protein [Plebeiobacterium marinum]MCW3806147.1 hypothetical protein [Plebeiobacterium marinum]
MIQKRNRQYTEEKVIELLASKGECLYGDIIKELNLSYSVGQEVIFSLITKGLIQHCDKSSKLELKLENIR